MRLMNSSVGTANTSLRIVKVSIYRGLRGRFFFAPIILSGSCKKPPGLIQVGGQGDQLLDPVPVSNVPQFGIPCVQLYATQRVGVG